MTLWDGDRTGSGAWHVTGAVLALLIVGAAAAERTSSQNAAARPQARAGMLPVDAVKVPLDPDDPSVTAIGPFRYAGGIAISSKRTTLLHGLSDIAITSDDRFTSIGDEGITFTGRLLLDSGGQLVGIADGALSRLLGENGRPVTGASADAEGVAVLPGGDRLVSFERHPRIWLYPRVGGRPRPAPFPHAGFPSNAGMEALAADPTPGTDTYMVGGEDSGETWTCRLSNGCQQGPTIEKPREYGLVALNWLPDGSVACLLRAYDPVRHSRVILKIMRGTTLIARMDLAPPMTVDNFEGLTSVAIADGGRRFYLLSDDNNRPTQRTLLMAFDWGRER